MADHQTATSPPPNAVAPLPVVGDPAPATPELGLPRGKPTLLWSASADKPVAERTFRALAALSAERPQLACIAVACATREAADRWIAEVGGAWETEVVVDDTADRPLYARWGLGLATAWQLWNPRALYATVALGRREGIWARPTPATNTDGRRWQQGGAFAVDAAGIVRWVHVPAATDDLVDFNPVLQMFGLPELSRRTRRGSSASPSLSPRPSSTLGHPAADPIRYLE
ncbi:Thioredoxin-like fold protein [Niveomyces insectorum RCEF 264]|uniref:Thioredoxin-like fold protein n=1 Tax=Niveomyces insectorum RCEF 264 TaxID=1081102 RepID=A0A167Y769_9HYPO|nr:Thioredoxin-like fold protein [Niveomyces insectorum RCEF 264]